jgi:UDP-2,3-diacylglucosamine hydrolase
MVSDAHLVGPGDPNQRAMVAWLRALETDRLYILGDLFHHWWGYSGAVMTAYVPVCAALMALAERGVAIHVVPGNHDFATGPFFTDVLGATVSGVVVEELGGRRFLLAHGDESDDRLGYRLTRFLLRGRAMAGLMAVLGPGRGARLLERLAGASREHMGEPGPLLAQQQRWAWRELARHDAVVAVLGHVHHPAVVVDGEKTIIHIGAWIGHRTFLLVEDGVPSLRRWPGEGTDPLGVPVG